MIFHSTPKWNSHKERKEHKKGTRTKRSARRIVHRNVHQLFSLYEISAFSVANFGFRIQDSALSATLTCLLEWNKFHAHGRADFDVRAGGCETSAFRIDAEDDDVV